MLEQTNPMGLTMRYCPRLMMMMMIIASAGVGIGLIGPTGRTLRSQVSHDKKQAAGAIHPMLAPSPSKLMQSVAKTKILVKMSSITELRTVK